MQTPSQQRQKFELDLITLGLYLVLALVGWMTVYAVSSASGGGLFGLDTNHGKQMLWIGISMFVGAIIISLDTTLVEGLSYVAYGISLLVLVVVLFVGREVNGAKSWIVLGSVSLQPSELAKITTIMALSKYMSGLNFTMQNPRHLFIAASIVLTPAAIVLAQNDTGSALVFCSLIIVFFREGLHPMVPLFILLTGAVGVITLGIGNVMWTTLVIFIPVLISFILFYRANKRKVINLAVIHGVVLVYFIGLAFSTQFIVSKLPKHQQNRIMVLFDPQIDPQGKGYNVIQSKIAIGSGGIIGKGYLEGNYTKYKFVPKQVTDFIFCAIGEEYGWIGSSLLILIIFAFLLRIKHIAENSKTRFARIFGYGALSITFFHTAINIGMTIGLIPVIGIPLPMVSYGGSSVLAFSIMSAILINLYSYRGSILGSKY